MTDIATSAQSEIRPFEINNVFSKITENSLDIRKVEMERMKNFTELSILMEKKMPLWMLDTLKKTPHHSTTELFSSNYPEYKFKNLIFSLYTLKKSQKPIRIDFDTYVYYTPLGKFWKIEKNNKISKTYKLPKIHKCFKDAFLEFRIKTTVSVVDGGHLIITFKKI